MEGEERWKVEGGGVEWGGREVEGRWREVEGEWRRSIMRWKGGGREVEGRWREVEWKEERLSFLWSLRPHAPLHTDHIGGHIIHWSRYFCIKYISDTLYFLFIKLNKYRYRENMHLSNGL